MTQAELERIVAQRMARWTGRILVAHATPTVLVAVGHDHANGKIVICTPDDTALTDAVIAGFLRYAARQLDPAGEPA